MRAALPPPVSSTCVCTQSVSEEGLVNWQHFSRCRRAPYNRLAEHLSSQTSLAQDHSMCSVLAARPLQGNACSERDDTSEVVPGSGRRGAGVGNSGATLPCGHGERTRGKRGQGRPANKGPLALSWKKQQRRTK